MRCSFNLDAEKNLEVLAFNIFSKIFDNGDSLSFFDLYFFFSVADFKNDFNLGSHLVNRSLLLTMSNSLSVSFLVYFVFSNSI